MKKKTTHKLILGDSRKMSEIADESIHLVVTSPPYWQLKDYGAAEQIGFYDSYEDYINNLNLVWQECFRILKPGCRVCVNIGDQFARSVYYGRYKVIPIRTEIIKFCEISGMDYMGAIIWQKVTTCNTSGGASIMGSYPYPRNGILKLDYEFILLFKKPGAAEKVEKEIKDESVLTKEEWKEYFSGHWNFPGEKQKGHIAMFPEELPKRLIKMFTFAGETVLDPFAGSGTTMAAAKNLKRNSLGYEINKDFSNIITSKLKNNNSLDYDFKIIEGKNYNDYSENFKKLPYIFEDHVKVIKKSGAVKQTFGSRINGKEIPEEYYRVKEVVGPGTLILNNNKKVMLIGIKEIKEKHDEAVLFLKRMTKGKQIYLKYDNNVKNGYCYLYLKNKTFLNAHLIKKGLVSVDEELDYKHKKRFIKYSSL